ncbi:MAG TPA: Clp1/GlmU family protein [Methanospirillum sp.]|nr:Clp1/GlmU family protein [Methanospirillum sp.]
MILTIPVQWSHLVKILIDNPKGVVYVIGGTDVGKSTFCQHLYDILVPRSLVGLLDCDTGQSRIGPPGTQGLAMSRPKAPGDTTPFLKFAGCFSPSGCLLPFLSGVRRLRDLAMNRGALMVIIDSPGYACGDDGQEFQYHMIEMIQPDHLIAITNGDELYPLISGLSHRLSLRIHQIPASPLITPRSAHQRAAYRTQQLDGYFRESAVYGFSLREVWMHGRIPRSSDPDLWHGLLAGLCDRDGLLIRLAIVQSWNPSSGMLTVLSPPLSGEEIVAVEIGSVRINLPSSHTI